MSGRLLRIFSLSEGVITDDEDEILKGIFEHCKALYTKDNQVDNFQPQTDKVLSLIDKTFLDEDNLELKEMSEVDEIQRIVFGLPKGKLPRGDGVTYKFLQETWDFVCDGCVAMVQEF